MKRYKITVNGQSYDVSVEEQGGAGYAAPVAAAPVQVAAPAASAAAPAAAPAASGGSAHVAGAMTVKAPMPGTVMSFKVIVGQAVKKGDVLLILEAMKMENEIVAPQDGTVASLRVPVSASVNTGDDLVDLS